MIILAETPNDKGAQLEALTQRLLRHCGYENCTTNVMANGAEIDVRGELPLPSLGQTRRYKLICECKAHKAVMDMTQWCKFLGKVYHQEVCGESEVAGCFISLSGVNGHVQGNFDELRCHRTSISLLHGDDLMKRIEKIIPFVSLSEVSRRTSAMTDRTASRFEIAYHDGTLYWVVVFSGGEFTMFTADGSPVESGIAEQLAPMAESELDVSSYIDIKKELQARQRATFARTLVVATLFECDGRIKGIDSFGQIDDFSPLELQEAAQGLCDEGHLIIDGDDSCAIPLTSTEGGDHISPELYRILFGSALPNRVLSTDFYQRHITRAMLKDICKIQGELPLRDEDAEEIISLLRLSPSALAQSLTPMQMIVTGRESDVRNESCDNFHRDYFRQVALESLKRDFRNPALAKFFHEKMGLRELETATRLVLKSEVKIEAEAEFTERIAIGRAADSLGGGLIHIAVLKGFPQPWEKKQPQGSGEEEQVDGEATA